MEEFSSASFEHSPRSPQGGYAPHLAALIRVGFGKRFMALILDNLLVSIIVLGLFVAVGERTLKMLPNADSDIEVNVGTSDESDDEDAESSGAPLGIALSSLTVLASLSALVTLALSSIELVTGASPGKRLMGLEVAHADGRKGNQRLWFIRWVAKNAANVFTLVPGLTALGSLWSFVIFVGCFAALTSAKQALHDIFANSAVFHRGDVLDDVTV
jgi:uncharacterized RDD family membrane protein YckC